LAKQKQQQRFDARQIIGRARGATSARRIYGKPYEKDGVTIIPAAKISGGYGGGGGNAPDSSEGSGFGVGMHGRPVGAFVIANGKVRWKPALDMTSVVLRAQTLTLAGVLLWSGISALRRR
jgi:uncharacterized spore protein YtfJ